MRALCPLLCLTVGLALAACNATPDAAPPAAPMTPPDVQPPVARTEPTTLTLHGHVRTDDYYWLRERDDPEVVAYLEAENAYTEAVMAPAKALEDALFEEIKGRIQEEDATAPYQDGGYVYYTRYEEGLAYPIHCRKKGSLDAPEEILLDVNAMAEGHDFFAVRGREVSPGQDLLAYAVDAVGRRLYTLHVKNLTTGEVLPDVLPDVTGNAVWANDNRTLFYSKQDPSTLRWNRIYRHLLGTDPATDVLVYEETDDTFYTSIRRSKSRAYLLIASTQTLSTEVRYLDAEDPTGTFTVFLPRRRDHEYHVDHLGDAFYIRTNADAPNFRLMKTPVTDTARAAWEEVIPHRPDVLLRDVDLFRDYLVLSERKNGLTQLHIRPWDGRDGHDLDFGEPAYQAYASTNPEVDTPTLRYVYSSMTTPSSVYHYDMSTRRKTLVKRDSILGDFDPSHYVTERLYAPARDGTPVPISLVYRRGVTRNGTAPLLLYGYGSYGASRDASFSAARLSLLDRGFVYAIAHVRGGSEMGRAWYEDGKLLHKMNTFTDFIDCGDFLVSQRYADPERLFARGGSAGGLLMGAVINLRPDLFRGVVAAVPFVDVLTTMLDDAIPLTTNEYDEWGNPNDPVYYDYIRAYSPYDNVEPKAYPHLLVTTGLHDSQVQYWEPAKWVAKLRAMKTDTHRLLLKTDMEAGHGGASGRYERYRDTAFQYAFLLDLAGITHIARSES